MTKNKPRSARTARLFLRLTPASEAHLNLLCAALGQTKTTCVERLINERVQALPPAPAGAPAEIPIE